MIDLSSVPLDSIIVCFFADGTKDYTQMTIFSIQTFLQKTPQISVGLMTISLALQKHILKEIKPEYHSRIKPKIVSAEPHLRGWNPTQYKMDIVQFAEEFESIFWMDSDTITVNNLIPHLIKFSTAPDYLFCLVRDHVMYNKHFLCDWEFIFESPCPFIPQACLMGFKSYILKPFIYLWKSIWNDWISPAPFQIYPDPRPRFSGSAFCIEQYAFGMALEQFTKQFKERYHKDVYIWEFHRKMLGIPLCDSNRDRFIPESLEIIPHYDYVPQERERDPKLQRYPIEPLVPPHYQTTSFEDISLLIQQRFHLNGVAYSSTRAYLPLNTDIAPLTRENKRNIEVKMYRINWNDYPKLTERIHKEPNTVDLIGKDFSPPLHYRHADEQPPQISPPIPLQRPPPLPPPPSPRPDPADQSPPRLQTQQLPLEHQSLPHRHDPQPEEGQLLPTHNFPPPPSSLLPGPSLPNNIPPLPPSSPILPNQSPITSDFTIKPDYPPNYPIQSNLSSPPPPPSSSYSPPSSLPHYVSFERKSISLNLQMISSNLELRDLLLVDYFWDSVIHSYNQNYWLVYNWYHLIENNRSSNNHNTTTTIAKDE